MTKQTVEIIYHDPEQRPIADKDFPHHSIIVIGYFDGRWARVRYFYEARAWFSCTGNSPVKLISWIDEFPPPPKPGRWVTREVEIKDSSIMYYLPPSSRNRRLIYDIKEEQP